MRIDPRTIPKDIREFMNKYDISPSYLRKLMEKYDLRYKEGYLIKKTQVERMYYALEQWFIELRAKREMLYASKKSKVSS